MSVSEYRRAARQYFEGPLGANEMQMWFEESKVLVSIEPGYTSRTLFLYPQPHEGGNAAEYIGDKCALILEPQEARELAGFLLGYADAMDKQEAVRAARAAQKALVETNKE